MTTIESRRAGALHILAGTLVPVASPTVLTRIAIGLLVALMFMSVCQANPDPAAGLLAQALKEQAAHAERFDQLNARFAKLPTADILTAANVTTPEGIASGKATVTLLRVLVAERDSLMNRYRTEQNALMKRLPSESGRRGAIEAAKRSKLHWDAYSALSTAQNTWADRMDNLLDWCAAQGGSMTNENGKLRFAKVEQHRDWLELGARLAAAEAAEEKIMTELRERTADAAVKLEQVKKNAAKILK